MLKVIEGSNVWSQGNPRQLISITKICTYNRSMNSEGEEVYECIAQTQTCDARSSAYSVGLRASPPR